jgi:hypothetical protein
MGDVPVPGYQSFWTNKHSTLKSEHLTLVQQYPDADAQLKQLFKVLGDNKDVVGRAPASGGESAKWAAIVNAAEEKGVNYSEALTGKTIFSALYGIYTVTTHELKALLKANTLAGQTNSLRATGQQTTQEDGSKK